MRRTFIFLTAVALVVLLAGAVNRTVVTDLSYLVAARPDVSLFWVAVGVAVLVVAAGVVAALLARQAAAGAQRKLEGELDEIYRRLREAEARVARQAPAPGAHASAAASVAPTAAIAAGDEAPTTVAPAVAETSVTSAARGEEPTRLVSAAAPPAVTAITGAVTVQPEPTGTIVPPASSAETSVTRVVPGEAAGPSGEPSGA